MTCRKKGLFLRELREVNLIDPKAFVLVPFNKKLKSIQFNEYRQILG